MAAARFILPVAMLAAGLALGWIGATWRATSPQDAASRAIAPESGSVASPASAPNPSPDASGSASGERRILYWYDPMVPAQKFDKPGKSPFMDMQLVPRYAEEAGPSAHAGQSLAVSTRAQQALGMRLASVERRQVGETLEAVGTLLLNEREISIVQARTAGFVERTYARAPGDVVAAGAPLADLLNPEWLGAQQEYLAVKALGDAALTGAARSRLALLGMPAGLIDRVDQGGQPIPLQTVTAPTGGVITELAVRNGMTVAPGTTLARINGLGTVWLEAAVPESQAATVRPGLAVEARFPALPGERVSGRVATILPEANRETRTLRVRIELPNPRQRLRAGLFAQVSFASTAEQALIVPAEAVIRTGRRAMVYLAEAGGRFRPLEIEIGEQYGEHIVVRAGLSAGQQVVASGQFLIDSEASLQGVLARVPAQPVTQPMTQPTTQPLTGATVPPAAQPTPQSPSAPAPQAQPRPRSAVPEYQTRGVIVELEGASITLTHEAIAELKWPSMTMPFKLADRKLARGLAKGQTVGFAFFQKGDDYVVTRIAPAPSSAGAAAGSGPPENAEPSAKTGAPAGAAR